jgi:hypothetical protein
LPEAGNRRAIYWTSNDSPSKRWRKTPKAPQNRSISLEAGRVTQEAGCQRQATRYILCKTKGTGVAPQLLRHCASSHEAGKTVSEAGCQRQTTKTRLTVAISSNSVAQRLNVIQHGSKTGFHEAGRTTRGRLKSRIPCQATTRSRINDSSNCSP